MAKIVVQHGIIIRNVRNNYKIVYSEKLQFHPNRTTARTDLPVQFPLPIIIFCHETAVISSKSPRRLCLCLYFSYYVCSFSWVSIGVSFEVSAHQLNGESENGDSCIETTWRRESDIGLLSSFGNFVTGVNRIRFFLQI